jgi:hypothetical protein
MAMAIPTGPFTCYITLTPIRPAKFVREDRGGVTYLIARDYELAYETVLRFADGNELPVKARLAGELNEQVVVRNGDGKPSKVSGFVQGRTVISDPRGTIIFRGRYYDARVVQHLIGDESLTPTGRRVVDHWENGFGEGPYAGHAIALGVQLSREKDGPMTGEGRGHID